MRFRDCKNLRIKVNEYKSYVMLYIKNIMRTLAFRENKNCLELGFSHFPLLVARWIGKVWWSFIPIFFCILVHHLEMKMVLKRNHKKRKDKFPSALLFYNSFCIEFSQEELFFKDKRKLFYVCYAWHQMGVARVHCDGYDVMGYGWMEIE